MFELFEDHHQGYSNYSKIVKIGSVYIAKIELLEY